MRLQGLLYAAVVGTLMLTNVIANPRRGGMLAQAYASQVESLWASPTTLMASVQAVPR